MTDLTTKFEAAVAAAKNMTERPDNSTLLKLYGLYKQGSQGDNDGVKPGFSDMVGRVKWEAWTSMKGTPREQAMQQYLDLFETLG